MRNKKLKWFEHVGRMEAERSIKQDLIKGVRRKRQAPYCEDLGSKDLLD